MTSRLSRFAPVALALLLVPAVCLADGFGYQGWGPRVGISSDPDQVFGGVHVDLGEFASHVRFQPSAEIGFGDHVTTLTMNGMVSYYFPVNAPVTPYAGGEITAAFYNFDSDCEGFARNYFGRHEHNCGSETEIGPAAVGGIEMKMNGGSKFLAEVSLGIGDLPQAKLTAGWTF